MPRGWQPAQVPRRGHNLHGLSKMPDQQATHDNGRHPRPQTALASQTTVRHHIFPPTSSLPTNSIPPQTKPSIQDRYPATAQSRTNSSQTSTATTKTPAHEHRYQPDPNAKTWTAKPTRVKTKQAKDAHLKPQHQSSRHMNQPSNAHDLHEAKTLPRQSAHRRNLSHHPPYPPTTSPSMKATTKTKRASRGTVTVTRSVSVRWSLVITTPARANGSICLVWA
jgi:hypothetical protein